MNKKQHARIESLMPNGIPKYIRIYDNSGTENETADNFTVVFSGNYRKRLPDGRFDCWIQVIGMGSTPFSPLGVCMHSEYEHPIDTVNGWTIPIGRSNHLGKRINFTDLPKDCQKVVRDDYMDIWKLNA